MNFCWRGENQKPRLRSGRDRRQPRLERSEASQRKDRCLIAPSTLKGGTAQKLAAKLLTAGLVREIKAKTGKEAWRRDEETGQAYSLKLTDAGLKAIAADPR